jgi:hypothetical protein
MLTIGAGGGVGSRELATPACAEFQRRPSRGYHIMVIVVVEIIKRSRCKEVDAGQLK